MKTKIIRIGNSLGIMLSKNLLQQYELISEVEIVPKRDGILLKPPASDSRAGWEEQFEQALKNAEIPEKEMLGGFANDFDNKDWTW
jgi:antitoxin MazE